MSKAHQGINPDQPHWKAVAKDAGLQYTFQTQDEFLVVEVMHITHPDTGDGIVDMNYYGPLDQVDKLLMTLADQAVQVS